MRSGIRKYELEAFKYHTSMCFFLFCFFLGGGLNRNVSIAYDVAGEGSQTAYVKDLNSYQVENGI